MAAVAKGVATRDDGRPRGRGLDHRRRAHSPSRSQIAGLFEAREAAARARAQGQVGLHTELRVLLAALLAAGEALGRRRDRRGHEGLSLVGSEADVVSRDLQPLVVHPVVPNATPHGHAEELIAVLLVEPVELGVVALEGERERDDVGGHGGALAAQVLQALHRVDQLLRLRVLRSRRPASTRSGA